MKYMEQFKELVLISGLLFNSILDIRKKRVSVIVIIIMGVCAVAYNFYYNLFTLPESLLSFVPGIIMLILAFLSDESIGYGDGVLMLCLGLFAGMEEIFLICMLAVSVAGIMAMIFVFICHKRKDYEIPFVPFILLKAFVLSVNLSLLFLHIKE